jgi:hypothetical protein
MPKHFLMVGGSYTLWRVWHSAGWSHSSCAVYISLSTAGSTAARVLLPALLLSSPSPSGGSALPLLALVCGTHT